MPPPNRARYPRRWSQPNRRSRCSARSSRGRMASTLLDLTVQRMFGSGRFFPTTKPRPGERTNRWWMPLPSRSSARPSAGQSESRLSDLKMLRMLRSGTIEPRQWELGLWNELDNEIPDHALFDPRPLAILQEGLKDPH